MIKKILTLALLITVEVFAYAQDRPVWSLDDVLAAHKQGSYVELADHILDVRPSERNSAWAEVFKATISYQIDAVNPGERILINLETLDLLKTTLTKEQLDPAFLIKVGKFMRVNSGNAADAIVWFADAINSTNQVALCSDSDVELAVVASLYLPESQAKFIQAGQKIADLCWQQMRSTLKANFAEGVSYYYKNTCSLLFKNEPTGSSDLLKAGCSEQGVS